MQAAALGEVLGVCIWGAVMSLWLGNGEETEMWKAWPGAVGVRDTQLDVGVSTAQKTKLGAEANKKPDCTVVADTRLRMGSGMHVSGLCFFSK